MNLPRRLRLGFRFFPALLEALVWVTAFRIGLIFFKYPQLSKKITLAPPNAKNNETTAIVLAWSVKQAARLVPFASCLTQALSLQHMLARRGLTGVIRVGVKIDESAKMDAHAWVILDETVLLGGQNRDLSEYKVLTDLTVAAHD